MLEVRLLLSSIVVNNATDAHVANEISLREAVATANTDAVAGTSDSISFDPSLAGATIRLTQGQLELSGAGTGTITIDGGSSVTVSGNDASRVLLVDAGVNAVLNNLTIDAGKVTNDNGGGIFNLGTLSVSNSTVSNSSASSGGGIENEGGLTLSNTTFTGNSASTGADVNDYSGTVTLEGQGWINSGTITASNQSTLNLYGNWTNRGSISVDSSSTLSLGTPIFIDPTSSGAAAYVWTNSGTIAIANGATLNWGGVSTADDFDNLPQHGISATLALDKVYLTGTIDNSVADNPVSAGVLALNASTGPLYLFDGEIFQGTVTTSGSDDLVATDLGGTLYGVTLDGILDMTQFFGANVGIQLDLTLDGTVQLGSVSGAGNDADLFFGDAFEFDNTPQTISGTGTIQFGQGTNLNVLENDSSTTLTIGPNITIQGGLSSDVVGYGPIDFQGTIDEHTSGGKLSLYAPWTNDGTITASNQSTLSLYGNWTNRGSISVDSSSTLGLGTPITIDPTSSGAAAYVWTNSGTIAIANGATLNWGGVSTADDFDNLPQHGISATLAHDKVYLTGTIDNSVADNPVSVGVLALNASTGPLYLSGGEIYQGTITTSGADDLVATSLDGYLVGVTLDGTLDMTQTSRADVTVLDGLTLDGTIELGGASGTNNYAVLDFGSSLDNTPQTISGTGTIQFGQAYYSYLQNLSNATFTIGPNITIQGAHYSEIDSGFAAIDNEGTIAENISGGAIEFGSGSSVNNSGSVLVGSGATLAFFAGVNYTQSGGTTTVDGTLTAAGVNLNGGTLDGAGTVQANVTNAAAVSAGDGTGKLTVKGNYTQTAAGALDVELGGSSQYSQLAVTGTAALNGALDVSTVNNFVPGGTDQFVALTFSHVLGNFATTQGLGPYANGAFLTLSFTTSNLTLAPALPNLVLTPTAPTSAIEGASIPLSWTVANQSTTTPAAAASWTDTVYLSTKSVLDGTAIPLITVAAPPQSPLEPGASYTSNVSANVPGNLTPGSYYLLFVGDANGAQALSDSANDFAAVPITLSAADLAVTSGAAPSTANLGDSVAVSWTVKNIGNAPADQSWQDAVYLSSTNTLTSSAKLLQTFAAPPSSPLAAGGSYTLNENVAIPTGAATGAQFLLFVTDSNGGQGVSSTASEVFAAPITLSAPQLTLQDFAAPGSGQFGQTINVSWQVTNAGSLPLDQNWSDEVFFSTKSTLDRSATLLDVVPASDVVPLGAGAFYTRNVTVTLPLGVSSANGTYYLFVAADGQDQLAIPNRSATIASQPISMTLPPLPDLTPSGLSLPATAYNGQKVLVSWVDTNSGTATAAGPWVDDIYLSSDAHGDNAALVAQVTYPNSLAVGQQSPQLTQPIVVPSTPGTYYLKVVADASGIDEGPNSVNNTVVDPTPITVVQAPLPDLVVTSITPPSGVVSGTTVQVTYTVTNQGTASTNAAQWHDAIFISQSPTLTLTGNDFNDGFEIMTQPLGVPVFAANPSYLEPGQSYSQTVNVPIPVSASGTWYVYVVTNRSFIHTPLDNFIDTGPVTEINSINDMTASTPFTVTLAPVPDLTVSNVQTPLEAFSGQPMNISWTVSNQGAGIAIGQPLHGFFASTAPKTPALPANSTWTDEVFMSPDPTLDSKAISLGTFTHSGALDRAANYADSEQVTLPVGVSGAFYFIVQTDINGQVFESGSSAHEVSATPSAITVNLTPPPDLQTTITSAPATALASHALTFTYQVGNIGAGATEKLQPGDVWNDTFYLSPTSTFSAATAILLGQQTYAGSLDAGASYRNTITETLPNALSGSYYLIVAADSGNVVFELDQTSKLGASSSGIQVSSKPADLIVSAAGAPPTGQAGGAVLVNWTVTNQGTGDTAVTSWQDNVYADTGSALSSNGILLGSFTHTGLLDAGASYSQSQLVTLPINLSGSYNLFVVTNQPVLVAGQPVPPPPVYESNFNNDTSAALPISVLQNLADLEITSVTAPGAAQTGGSVTVNWTVLNDGTGTTNSNYWYDDVWVSTHPTLQSGGNDVYLGTLQHTNPLVPGGSYSASLAVTVPPALAAGTYYFIVAVDRPVQPPGKDSTTDNLVYESNESNNEEAAAATDVTLGPNLVVSNVTAPASINLGQTLAVGWTVTNNGAGGTGNIPIQDSVYLSYDQVLSNSSLYVGTVTQTGGLAAGASYTQNTTLQLPSGLAGTFYVFVVTDTNQNVYEQNPANAVAYDATPLKIQPTPPADLVAGTVTIPANAVAGQNITITYQVTNNGANPANGAWTDALYLSPTSTWNVNDPLLGTVAEDLDLAAGASYTGTLTAPLPGVTPGSYYVIVRSNILDTIPETTLANNLNASLTETSITVPFLTLGIPATGTLGNGQSAFYQVTVDAGQTLEISFDSQAGNSLNELYVSFGSMPSRGQAQYTFQGLAANQEITIPVTQAGSYYILAYGSSVPNSPETYSMTAALVPFSIKAVAPGTVGTGTDTIEIDGAKFDNNTTFQLLGPDNTLVNDQTVFLQDSSTAFVTFNLTGMPTGTYTVQATAGDGTTTQLASSLTVVPATAANLEINLSAPASALPDSNGVVTVSYINLGNTDAVAPLLQLSADTALLSLYQGSFSSNSIQILGISSNGPAGIIRPGESSQVNVYFQGTGTAGQTANVSVQTADDSQSIDWSSQKAALMWPTFQSDAWNAVFGNLMANLGATVGSYHQVLSDDASYLSQFGDYISDPTMLYGFEVEKADAAYMTVTLSSNTDASFPAPGLALVFQRTFMSNIDGRYQMGPFGRGWVDNWQISAATDAQGNVTIQSGGQFSYFAIQPDGSYLGDSGNLSVLSLVNSAYQLRQPDGTIIAFNVDGTLSYEQDRNGNRLTAAYSGGKLASLIDSAGQSLTIAYNSQGLISSVTDPAGRVTTYSYDSSGQFLTSFTDASGTTTYTYVTGQTAAQNNALSSVIVPTGVQVTYNYDSFGRLIDQHLTGGAEDVRYTYLSPGGYTTTDADGSQATTLFDEAGNTVETITPLGQAVYYHYDALDELASLTGPLGTTYTFSYNSQGLLIGEVDPLGHQLTYTYNAANALTSSTDANGNTTIYHPDDKGNLLSVTSPDGASQQWTYDPLGEASQFLNASGHAMSYTYNAQGLVLSETFADGSSYHFTYDSRTNLTGATDAQGNVLSFQYDPATDNLVEVVYPNREWLKFKYDSAGNRIESTDQTGFTINYSYDAADRLTELADGNGNLIVEYSYDAAGNLIQKANGNGTYTTYTYDADGNLRKITNYASATGPVNSYDAYTYDAWGRVLTDASQLGEWSYTYDADGELIEAAFASDNTGLLPSQSIQYVYDANGNRLSQDVNGVLTIYTVNADNECTSATTNGVVTLYQYDGDGNLISSTSGGQTTTYAFNQLNELTAVNGPGMAASYTYDPLGNRIGQTIGGVATMFQVDPTSGSNVVATYDGSGNLEAEFTHGFGLVSQVSPAGVASYYDFNNIGSTVGITGTTGTYVNQYAYLPFGATTTLQSSLANPFTLVGALGVSTDATNLSYMHNRVYDSAIGQFLSMDPLAIAGGPNPRAYTDNNPVSDTDPSGLKCHTVIVYTWQYGLSAVHSAISVDGQLLDKGTKTGDPYLAFFGEAEPTYNFAEEQLAGTGDQVQAQVFTVDDETGNNMSNRIAAIENFGPGFNIFHSNCAESVSNVLSVANPHVFSPVGFWTPENVRAGVTINMDRLQSPNCPPPIPDPKKLPYLPPFDVDEWHWVRPHDPNSIIGPAGFGDANFVSINQVLPYQIDFENEPTAGLPAQQVVITQQLDSNLNWQSFRLGSFGFGGQVFNVPANAAFYQTTIAESGFVVDVAATIDERSGIATWVFTTIDLTTGQIPLDPSIGFLPPDDANGSGEGFVSYTILAKPTDPTGTVINAQATVDFYTQPPINTPQISNTLDTGAGLASSVASLPAEESSTQFNVSWSGSDSPAGSGIADFTIYVSDDGGPFTPWLQDTTLTSGAYAGQPGHTYAFYSIARNNVGNVQPTPTAAQATITISNPPAPPSFIGEYAVATTGSNVLALASISQDGSTLTLNGSTTASATVASSTQLLINGVNAAYGDSQITFGSTGTFANQVWTKLDLPTDFTNPAGARVQIAPNGSGVTFTDRNGTQSPGIWTSPTQLSGYGESVTVGTGTSTGELVWADGTIWSEVVNISGTNNGSGVTAIQAVPSNVLVTDYTTNSSHSGQTVHAVQTGMTNIVFVDGAGNMVLGTYSDSATNVPQATAPDYPGWTASIVGNTITWTDGTPADTVIWTQTTHPASTITVTDYTNQNGVPVHVFQNGTNTFAIVDGLGNTSLGHFLSATTGVADSYPTDVATFSGNQVIWQDGIYVWTLTNNPPLLITFTDANNAISHVKLLTPTTLVGLDGSLKGIQGTRLNGKIFWSNGEVWDNLDFNALNAFFEMGTGFP